MTHAQRIAKMLLANELEVEHIIELTNVATRDDVPQLRLLQRNIREHGEHEVLYATWLDVVCSYLEKGYAGLEALARQEAMLPFVASLLSEMPPPDSTHSVARIVRDHPQRASTGEFAEEMAEAANLLTSLAKNPETIDPEAILTLRNFLHSVIRASKPGDRAYAAAIYGLRGVGDESSLRLLDEVKDAKPPNSGAKKLARTAIKRRLAQR